MLQLPSLTQCLPLLKARSQVSSRAAGDSDYEKNLHISASVAGMVIMLLMKFHIHINGFRFSRSFRRSTDDIMWILMGIIIAIWTTFIILSAYRDSDENPCLSTTQGTNWQCLARLAFVPWILIGMFFWWAAAYVFHRLYLSFKSRTQPQHPNMDNIEILPPEPTESPVKTFFSDFLKPWKRGVSNCIVILMVWSPIIMTTIGAYKSKMYTMAMLNIVAAIYFLHVIPQDHYFMEVPHTCELDDVRIPIASPAETCMVYILPSKGFGFDAAVTRKVLSEHKILDTELAALDPLSAGTWSLEACRAAINNAVLARVATIAVSNISPVNKKLNDLARWLYSPEQGQLPIRCSRAPNRSLIGREVAAALLHWERLVFERRWQLDFDLRADVWQLRSPKYGGAIAYQNPPPKPVLGSCKVPHGNYLEWFDAFREVVFYVYSLLDPREDLEDPKMPFPAQLYPQDANPPFQSVAFDEPVAPGINEYAGQLWKHCWAADPSTFGALYLWTAAWYLDMGNVHSIHLVPLS